MRRSKSRRASERKQRRGERRSSGRDRHRSQDRRVRRHGATLLATVGSTESTHTLIVPEGSFLCPCYYRRSGLVYAHAFLSRRPLSGGGHPKSLHVRWRAPRLYYHSQGHVQILHFFRLISSLLPGFSAGHHRMWFSYNGIARFNTGDLFGFCGGCIGVGGRWGGQLKKFNWICYAQSPTTFDERGGTHAGGIVD